MLARVAELNSVNATSSTGVMLRDSLDADARNIYVGLAGDGTLFLQYRSATGTNTVTANTVPAQVAPLWLKLQREQDLFTGSYSLDGENWMTIGTVTATLKANMYGGVATASGTAIVSSLAVDQFAIAVNGRVEAEDYSDAYGVQAETTQDVGGGENIGYIGIGDWMNYTLNITTGGIYSVDFRLAAPATGAQLNFSSDGELLGTLDIPHTGSFQSWATTQLENIEIPAGIQTFTIDALSSSWNINWFSLTYIGPLSGEIDPAVPTGLSASAGIAADRIDLQWGPVEGEYEYDVWRSATTNPAMAAVIATGCYNSCSDTNVSPGSSYTYWVAVLGQTNAAWFSAYDQGSTQGTSATWQMAHYPGGYPGDSADSDMDGYTSLEEFIANTDPTNSTSYFRITEQELSSQTNLIMQWDTAIGRHYSVEWTPSLSNDFIFLSGLSYPAHSYTNEIVPADQSGFFRVEVETMP